MRITRLEMGHPAGTLEFKAWGDFDFPRGYTLDTIRVTKGRFDL